MPNDDGRPGMDATELYSTIRGSGVKPVRGASGGAGACCQREVCCSEASTLQSTKYGPNHGPRVRQDLPAPHILTRR